MVEHGGGGAMLNLKQAAAALGVHYMTAYRYVRQGQLAADLVGTQWQVDPGAVAAFLARDQERTTAQADWVGRLERCLLSGDETAAWRVIGGALAAGHDPVACYLDLLSAALDRVGARFGPDRPAGAEQHVSTTLAIRLVARLGARFRRPGRSRGAVVFGSPPGELHSLPVAIAADVVRLSGFNVVELGADVPANVFGEAASRARRLVAVGVGVTAVANLREVPAIVDAVRAVAPHTPILLGGIAADSAQANAIPGVSVVAGDARAAVALLDNLLARRRGNRQAGGGAGAAPLGPASGSSGGRMADRRG